jgi:hypothetical protein
VPQTLDLHEHLINGKSVTISLMLPSQSLSIFRPEFVAPQSNYLVAHLDATMRHQIFDITMTEVESVVEPNGVLDYLRRESEALVHS